MKFFQDSGDEIRADFAAERQSSDTDLVGNAFSPLLGRSYRNPSIQALADALRCGAPQNLLQHPLEINALEMLEAELANQCITSLRAPKAAAPAPAGRSSLWTRAESCTSLAQRATLESTAWRWRGRRLGIAASKLRFRVDIRLFILSWAAELEQALESSHSSDNRVVFLRQPQLSSTASDDMQEVRKKLKYLDEVAAFLAGGVRRRAHPFDRGLDVILKVLSVPGSSGAPGHTSIEPVYSHDSKEGAAGELILTLPLSRSGFFEAVRAFSSEAERRC